MCFGIQWGFVNTHKEWEHLYIPCVWFDSQFERVSETGKTAIGAIRGGFLFNTAHAFAWGYPSLDIPAYCKYFPSSFSLLVPPFKLPL